MEEHKHEIKNIETENIKEEHKQENNIFNCSICETEYKTMNQYNKHLKSEEHEKQRVIKGIYTYGKCPYCRTCLYLLDLPNHIKGNHKEYYDKWKDAETMNNIDKLKYVSNKIKELDDTRQINNTHTTLYKDDENEIIINNDDLKEHKKIVKQVKHRRGKYRHMTDEQIKAHKKRLTKERQRRFYEKNRKRYKELNLKNYEKRKSKTQKPKGRPPIYED